MAQNIFVKARNKETGTETVITYKAYLDIQSILDLVGQSDEHGILIPGDPNLQPAHRRPAEKSGATVDNFSFTLPACSPVLSHSNTGEVLVFDTESGSLEPIPGAVVTETLSNSDTSNPETRFPVNIEFTESDTFHVEPPAPASEPIKERKKPGPKPKIKQNEV